ncbi:P-loop NTPase family protein [Helicobacter felis]|uniref:hypothetical protein n=1 Tax=Helicobacter felis TaxID=214 RepID=UPI000CF0556C|nr:hypothetical protein [Helicobacter felis]
MATNGISLHYTREGLKEATGLFKDHHKVFGAWLQSSFKEFEHYKAKSLECLAHLEKQENLDIALVFFGETNAGKSTLIEALRLFFKEKGKLATQEMFKESPSSENADGAIIGATKDFTKSAMAYSCHFACTGGGGGGTSLS